MRDLTLSLLSRGCGLVARSHHDSQDGRLEVCFEPEDYYIWKSHQPQLRLSNSGRFLGGVEPVPPKTYSTRRGPLFLYSEDLASMTTGLPEASRKRQVSQQSRQEMDLHLHTLRDLTGAILAYGKKRLRGGTASATGLPSLPLPTILDPLPPSSKVSLAPMRATRQPRPIASLPAREPGSGPPSSPRHHRPPIGLDPLPSKRFLSPRTEGMEPDRTQHLTLRKSAKVASHVMEDCEERITEADWKEKETKDLRRFEVVFFTPRVHMSPMPETEPPWQVDGGGRPPGTSTNWDLHMEPDCSLNSTTKDPEGVGLSEMAEERCYPLNMASVDTSWASSRPSLINFYGGHLVGVRHRQIVRLAGVDSCVQRVAPSSDPSLMLPPPSEAPQCCLPPISLAPLVSQGEGREAQARGLTCDVGVLEPREPGHHLPTIQEGCVRPGAGSRGVDRRGRGGDGENSGGEREKHKRQEREKEYGGGGGKAVPLQRVPRKAVEQACVLLEPEEECPPPLGVLPPLARRQGPARQYFLSQYRPDPQDETWEDPRTVVRGTLPLELREGQKGRSWGTLIMGPDGEIIQLSLWDPKADNGDPSHLDDVTRENALHVLSSAGEKLPWILLLQPEATDTDRQGCETTDPAGEGMRRNPEAILPNKDASHPIPAPRTGVQGILGDLQQRGERQAPGHRSPSHRDRTRQAPGAYYSDNQPTTDKAERNISTAAVNGTHNMEMTKEEAREDTGQDVRKYMKKEAVKKRWKEIDQVKTNRGHRQPATQSNQSSLQPGQETSSSGRPASEQANFNPNPTERLSQGTWSEKRNLRNSEGPLTPSG
ncbi:uncharacterized protein LOC134017299 isoform X2 [Osmerus eperlanus]|uniref:uncharacterized protein LOC134017299 isoform X2 n=1 Tax=Osmerus eperlanus TaxID=29151 RepID=UPI002E167E90